ncbi:MAG: M48 family metalloprotease [Candidatus Babeliales bacterium]
MHVATLIQDQCVVKPLEKKYEDEIRSIAREMGISEHFIIRKMNHKELLLYGYHNAVISLPVLFGFIPIGKTLCLCINEEFYKSLSDEEKRFLIGHEMVHIEKKDPVYKLCGLGALIFSNLLSNLAVNFFMMKKIVPEEYCISPIIIGFVIGIFSVETFLFYSRHIESRADILCLQKLQAYAGCLALLERWNKDYGLPDETPFWGLLSSHPSNNIRRINCQTLKNKANKCKK